jgi:hypothetical protein
MKKVPYALKKLSMDRAAIRCHPNSLRLASQPNVLAAAVLLATVRVGRRLGSTCVAAVTIS